MLICNTHLYFMWFPIGQDGQGKAPSLREKYRLVSALQHCGEGELNNMWWSCWNLRRKMLNEREYRDFPGGSAIGWSFTFSVGSIPGQEAQIPHAWRPRNQNIKQKHYYRKFKKDFQNGPHQKNLKKKKSVQFKKREGEREYGYRLGTGSLAPRSWLPQAWPGSAASSCAA